MNNCSRRIREWQRAMMLTFGNGGLILSLALVLLLMFNHLAWAAPDEQSPGSDKIVAVILEDAPPMVYRNKKTGEPAGFLVDITNEVARRAGFSVSYKFMDNWDTIREVIQRGDADIGPGVSISPEREGYYSFSDPFDTFTISIFVRAGTGMTELKPGASVGANRGSMAHELLRQRPGIQMIPYVNFQTGLFDILTGKIDAFAGPTPVFWRLAQDAQVEGQITVVGKPLVDVKRAFGVRKGRIELVTRLNKALYGFVDSPEYQKIYSKWYGNPRPYFTLTKQTIWTLIAISLVIIALVSWRYLSVTGLTRQLRREIEERKKIEENVLLSEERLRLALASSQQGWFDLDIPTGAIMVSPEYARMIGYDPAEFSTSLQGWIDGMHPEDRDPVLKKFHECLEKKDTCTLEYRRHTKTGEWLWIRTVGKVVGFDSEQRPLRMTGTHKDITEGKLVEEALQDSEEKFRTLAESSTDYIMRYDRQCRHTYMNPAGLKISGMKESDIIGKTHRESGFPENLCNLWEEKIQHVIETGKPYQVEFEWNSALGPVVLDWRLTPEFDVKGAVSSVLGVSRDITERKLAEEQLLHSLKEKEVLLMELHHRVKNNMQVMHSLLNLQASGITDSKVRAMFEESRNRIRSMALIHEKLYQSKDLAHIDFKIYLMSFVKWIAETYKRDEVVLSVDMESIILDVNVGIPCSLIVNELISNSLKHAFPEGRKGMIRCGLNKNSEGNYVLTIEDNGIGFPADVDIFNTPSFGLQLVNMLTEQLHGRIEFSRSEWTRYSIIFPGKKENKG